MKALILLLLVIIGILAAPLVVKSQDCPPPLNLTATYVNQGESDYSVYLAWEPAYSGAITLIKCAEGDAPATPGDGILVYWGQGNSTLFPASQFDLAYGDIKFRAWTQCSGGGSGTSGCTQSIGNITGTTGWVGFTTCNETLAVTSDGGTIGITAYDGNNTINLEVLGGGGGCANVFSVINAPAGTDPTAQGCTNILNLTASLGNITITGNGFTSTVDFTLDNSVTIDTEWDTVAKLEAIYGVQLWTSADGTLADDSVSLADVQGACTNDFHAIGGTDDDVPESGDFGAAGDLEADGTITDGVVDEADLDIANAPTDEYVLTYELATNNYTWELSDLNRAYEQGSSITCDVTDVLWTLNAANIDFIVNAANTGDFIVQDGGTAFWTFEDTGFVNFDGGAATARLFDIDQTFTSTGLNYTIDAAININDTGTPIIADTATYGLTIAQVFNANIEPQWFTTVSAGGTIINSSNQFYSDITPFAAWPTAATVGLEGFYGICQVMPASKDSNTASTTYNVRGMYFLGNFLPEINATSGSDTATVRGAYYQVSSGPNMSAGNSKSLTLTEYGLYCSAGMNPTVSAGTFTGTLYNLYLMTSGTTQGTNTPAYGIYNTISGADAGYNYAMYNIIPDAQTGIVIKVNTTQANADATLMDFRSTTGSEGTIALAAGGVVTYNAFTGSHYTQIQGDTKGLTVGTVLEIVEGDVHFPVKELVRTESIESSSVLPPIVESEARTETVTESSGASPDKEQLFLTRICQTEGSQAAVGVYGGRDGMERDFCWGLGTGMIRVANQGEDLAIGDYLKSSDVRGCAEKQHDDIYRSVTIAKVTEVVKWNLGEKERLVKCILLGG